MDNKEVWKPVKGYEGLYEVSNTGLVRSLPKKWVGGFGAKCSHDGKLLKLNPNRKGYLYVGLSKNKETKTFQVHRLVYDAFIGFDDSLNNYVVDHIDCNVSNNNIDNLRYISNRENITRNKKGTSKYTGVCFDKGRGKWYSMIRHNNKKYFLGRFDNEEDAGEAYILKLKELDNE